jgi:hypothetical protein
VTGKGDSMYSMLALAAGLAMLYGVALLFLL